ncbi:MAG: DVUA0089 family protein [Pirellula sp.]
MLPPPNDTDDAISEANLLGAVTTTPVSVSYSISPDVDVDMFRFSVTATQVVDFDIDTALNGAGGLGSYIRLFNAQGVQIATNDDGMAPGENTVGYDAYLRFTFATAGTYYLGVSNYNNATYDPITGNGDTSGGLHTTGDYQLIVQALPIDPDDSLSEAALLGRITSSPITTSASITPDIDVDMFRFTVTANQVVDFDIDTVLNGPGGLGSYIRLFSSQGVQIAFNNDAAAPDENGVGFDSYLRTTFDVAGTYYLGVSNVNNASYDPITGNGDTAGGLNSIGSYQLIVQAIVPANDPDDTIGEANALGVVSTTPISVSNSISPDIDVDMYKFSVSMGQVVDFDIDTPINGPGGLGSYIRLFDAQGDQLAFNNDAAAPGESSVGFDAYLRITFVNAGTYYLGVSNANNSLYNAILGDGDRAGGSNTVGTYQLIVQGIVVPPNETGGTLIDATSLGAVSTSPISVSESISPDVDVDMFRFTITAGQVVDFDIDTALNGLGGLGSFLRLFDSQGLLLAFNNDAAAPGENTVGFDAYLRYTFATAGTYYIGVSNANNTLYNPLTGAGSTAGGLHSTGAYQLTVQSLPIDVDDSLSEATLLGAITSTPITTNAILSPDIDVDMVRFTVTAGQIVDFDIDTAFNGPGGLGSFIRLFNSAGTQLDFNNDAAAPGESSVGFDAYLRYTFAAAGTYYLGVSNSNNTLYDPNTGNGDSAGGLYSIGAYQLIVQAIVSSPTDTDDSISEAIALGTVSTTPTTVSDMISPDVDVDIFKFNVTANQIVDFDIDTVLNGPGGLGSHIRLFNSQGTQLAFNNDAAAPGETVGLDSYLRYTFSTAGTYYLGVSNSNNASYDPVTGNGDTPGGQNSTGSYQLIVQAIVASTNDPDDAISEASVLGAASTTPISVSNSISPDVDVDMFQFGVTAGQVVDFDIDTVLNGPGGLGSFIRLFNAQGVQLAFNDDGMAPGESSVGLDAYLRFTFATTGTYYLGVSNSSNSAYDPLTGNGDTAGGSNATGAYQLIVQAVVISANDPDDSISEANALGVVSTTPISVSNSISPDIDVDMVRFSVTANQIVDFDIDTVLNGPGGLGSIIRLFDAQGTQLAFNNDAAAPGETVGLDSYLRYTFATAGTYYLGVSNSNNASYDPVTGNGDTPGGQNSTGSYQLIVQAIVASTNDPDDAISEANVLGAASTTPISVSNSISPDVDVDMFQFGVTAGQVVDFDIDTVLNGPGGLGSFIRLFNAQGVQLAFNDDGMAPGESSVGLDAYLRFTFATTGTYYLGVSNSSNSAYDPLTGNGDTAGGSNATGAYQLIVQAVVISANDPDDSISEANALGVVSTTPISVSNSILPDIDVDMFQFDVASGQVVDFDIDTTLNGSGGLGSFIRLFNAQGVELAFNDDAAAPDENTVGFDAYLRYTFPFAGKYFIGVSNNNNATYDPITGNGDALGGLNSTGAYQLTLQALPVDPDDSLAESNFLGAVSSTPVSVAFSITPDTDVDMFRFTVVANQVVAFDIDTAVNGPGGLGSYLRLFDAQGSQLDFNNDGAAPGETVGFDCYLQHTFAAPGAYYLGVSNSNNSLYDPVSGNGDTSGGQNSIGSYQLTVQSIAASANDPDDTISEANVIGVVSATPFSVSNSISPDVDVDIYRFSVTAGQEVDFDIDTALNGAGGLGSTIRLFNAQGTELAANNNAVAPGENSVGIDAYLRYTFTTAGTFYLGVSNDQNVLYDPISGNGDTAGGANATGAYQLIVQSIAVGIPVLMLTINPTSIPEVNGVATGRVSRINADLGQSITVTLASSDTSAATVTSSVVIPANASFIDFQIFAVHNTTRGTTLVTISATAQNFSGVDQSLLITDSDLTWHNFANPNDVDNDGSVSPLDVLSIINYLNVFGAGNVPAGSPPPYLDVNGDNQITPLDGLELINFLNRVGSGEGEAASWQAENVPSKSQRRIDAVYMQYGQDFFTNFEFLRVRGSTLRQRSSIH